MKLTYLGAVFGRSAAGYKTSSDNGIGTGSTGWQGYDIITGRILSPNLGMYINKYADLLLTQFISDFIVSVPRFNNYRGRVSYSKLIHACTIHLVWSPNKGMHCELIVLSYHTVVPPTYTSNSFTSIVLCH